MDKAAGDRKRVFDLVKRFGTSRSPNRSRSSTANISRAALRSLRLQGLPVAKHPVTAPKMAGHRVRTRAFLLLWRQTHDG